MTMSVELVRSSVVRCVSIGPSWDLQKDGTAFAAGNLSALRLGKDILAEGQKTPTRGILQSECSALLLRTRLLTSKDCAMVVLIADLQTRPVAGPVVLLNAGVAPNADREPRVGAGAVESPPSQSASKPRICCVWSPYKRTPH